MLAIERKNEILATVQKEQRVLVTELSQRYNVTEETIRRDLEKLEKEGFVKKTYGGAVLNSNTNLDLPLRIREKNNQEEKEKIASKVADMIEEGDSLMLDASSTSLMSAKKLKKLKKLTVITNAVEVLIELSGQEGIKVISTGGVLRDASLSLVGKSAERTLENYNADIAIISCKGLDLKRGVTESNEEEAEIKRAMRRCATQTFLAMDSSKFNRASFVRTTDLKAGDTLVTDRLDEEWRRILTDKGIRLVTCGEE